jgi:hypothetical protein
VQDRRFLAELGERDGPAAPAAQVVTVASRWTVDAYSSRRASDRGSSRIVPNIAYS